MLNQKTAVEDCEPILFVVFVDNDTNPFFEIRKLRFSDVLVVKVQG
jgi:hypothetical protein